MKDYFEIEIKDKEGNTFYEIAQNRIEANKLKKLHNGIAMKAVDDTELDN